MSQINHVAIIMDGNGRWASERMHTRMWGHIRGAKVVSKIVEEASNLSLKALTLYAFSTENWKRPKSEKLVLFSLLKKYVEKEGANLIKNNVRFRVIGSVNNVPDQTTISLIRSLEEKTKSMTGLKLNLAFDYGSRSEIITACNDFIRSEQGLLLSEEKLEKYLFTYDSGDVDLLIRTGGELRISNFLLWQSAYAELYFTDIKWPDFTPENFRDILSQIKLRERRFGQTSEQVLKLNN